MAAPVWPEAPTIVSIERAERAKAAFFDIDGTLMAVGGKVMYPSTVEALEGLKAKGVKIVVSTGRHLDYAREVERFVDFDGWLCANGSYCLLDGEVIRAQMLDSRDVRTVLEESREKGRCVALTYGRDLIGATPDGTRRILGDMWKGFPVASYDELDLSRPVCQLNVVVGPDEDEEVLAHAPHLMSARWTDAFMDVIPRGGGKPAGIRAVLDALGAEQDQCLAFGDGGNDISMLDFCGVGVAMGNATDRVKAHADYVTSPCDEDGIRNALVALGSL